MVGQPAGRPQREPGRRRAPPRAALQGLPRHGLAQRGRRAPRHRGPRRRARPVRARGRGDGVPAARPGRRGHRRARRRPAQRHELPRLRRRSRSSGATRSSCARPRPASARPIRGRRVSELLLRGGHVVTMDDAGSEHADGWVLVRDGLVAAVGGGAEPEVAASDRVDLGGALVTPGLVNTHHHLYQTLTRARAQDSTLFEWLVELYPVWAGLDAEAEYAAARTGLAELALSGCSTVFDHHYVFPRGRTGILEAELQAARELGLRFVASRGSMDLGEAAGRPAAGLARRDDRRDPGRHRARCRARRRRPAAGGRRAVLAVLGHARADGAVGGACAAPRPEAAHAPGRDRRGGRVLQRALRLHAGRVPGGRRLAGGRRLVRALRASARRRLPALRGPRRRHRPLPHVEPAPGRGLRAGARDARRGRGRRSRRRRHGLERARRSHARGQAGAARRARPRRSACDDGARRAAPRHARRRGRARARRHRLAPAREARRHRGLASRRPRVGGGRRRRPRRGARPLGARIASIGSTSAAPRSCATGTWCAPTRTRSPASSALRPSGSETQAPARVAT